MLALRGKYPALADLNCKKPGFKTIRARTISYWSNKVTDPETREQARRVAREVVNVARLKILDRVASSLFRYPGLLCLSCLVMDSRRCFLNFSTSNGEI
jgi:hypothetical protein